MNAAATTVEIAGDTWTVLNTGPRRNGTVLAHLASTTRVTPSNRPVTAFEWIPAEPKPA